MKDSYKFNVKVARPEDEIADVSEYFDSFMISKYAESKSLMNIQEKMTIRALEILDLSHKEGLFLDLGCGPGFVGIYLAEIGYNVVSIDLLINFLTYYDIKELNPLNSDMCVLPLKPEKFDAIISISALQWICNKVEREGSIELIKSLAKDAYNVLKPNSKAIFQFYPKNDVIMRKIGKIFIKSTRFKGGFVIDNPKSPKKRKIYLLLEKS